LGCGRKLCNDGQQKLKNERKKQMTAMEAMEALKAKYPQSEILVWDWLARRTYALDVIERNISVDVDSQTYRGATIEEAVQNVKAKTPEEVAAMKRAAAQKLLAEAAALEKAAGVDDGAK
jgi:hypothetical protein